MSVTLREIAVDDPSWTQFVDGHPAATPFHCPAWTRLVADCYGFRASALVLTDTGGQTVAGLPLVRVRAPLRGERAICLPFTDNCGPLCASSDFMTPLAEAAASWHNGLPMAVRAPLPEVAGWLRHEVAILHTLRLAADPESVFRTFKRTQVQQPIGRAERQGVVVRRAESFADLRLYYELHTQTRRRLGTPVQPLRFFRLLWERILSTGLGFAQLAFHEGRAIAGAVFLAWNGTVVYKYSASDSAFWRLRPNNLVLWSAIRWGCTNGFRVFDFGRTDFDNPGLRDFKDGWGTRAEPLVYSTLGLQARAARPVVPSQAAHMVSAFIRRSPPWVCRTLGELLYRYAA